MKIQHSAGGLYPFYNLIGESYKLVALKIIFSKITVYDSLLSLVTFLLKTVRIFPLCFAVYLTLNVEIKIHFEHLSS